MNGGIAFSIVTVIEAVLQLLRYARSHISYERVYTPESVEAGIINLPLCASILDPVILVDPVRDTVTFPVFACPPESVSFARISMLPPLHSMKVPESETAMMTHVCILTGGTVRVTAIFALSQLSERSISQRIYEN